MTTAPQAIKSEVKNDPKKAKKPPVALPVRVMQQLDRAVLARKLSREELSKLSQHISKLQSLLEE